MSCDIKCSEDEILNNCHCENFDDKNSKIKKIIQECEKRLKNLKNIEDQKKDDKNKILNKKNKSPQDLKDISTLENQISELTNLYRDAQKKCNPLNKNIINISINSQKEPIKDIVNENIYIPPPPEPLPTYIPLPPQQPIYIEESYKDILEKELKDLDEKYKQIKKEQVLTDVEIEILNSNEKFIKEKGKKDKKYLKYIENILKK